MVVLVLARGDNSQSNPTARFLHQVGRVVESSQVGSQCSPSSFHHFLWEELLRCPFPQMHNYNTWLNRLFCGSRECEDYRTEPTIWCDPYNERTASYRWTDRVWEITGSRLQEKLPVDAEKCTRIFPHLIKKNWVLLETPGSQPVMNKNHPGRRILTAGMNDDGSICW